MGIFDRLRKRTATGDVSREDRIREIYSQYALHSINNNSDDEAYERLDRIGKALSKADVDAFGEAAEAGNPEGMCLFAAALLEGWQCTADRKRAAFWFREAAKAGNAEALDTIAGFYLHGIAPNLGFTRNPTEAMRLYRLAAERGAAKSESALGTLLSQNPATAEEGITWIQKAAAQGMWRAMFNLALAYETGKGVAQNRDLAIEWYERAAQEGLTMAKERLEKIR
jgi:uncharacterized protein